MKWIVGGSVLSLLLLVFVTGFAIGGNIAVAADSHAEINNVVASVTGEIAETGSASPLSSLAASAVTVMLNYVAAPIAHLVYSFSFVPVVVWRFIGVSILLVALGLQTYSVTRVVKQVRTHG